MVGAALLRSRVVHEACQRRSGGSAEDQGRKPIVTEGWVYVVSNPAMPGLVKVGFTTKHPKERALELKGTGVPDSFVAEYAVRVQRPRALERAVHEHLRQLGLGAGKEWFKCPKEQAVAALLELGAEEIQGHYRAEDEARRLEFLEDQKVERERARVREEILRRVRQDKETRAEAQRSREMARQEAKDLEAIRRHQEQIEARRADVTDKLKSRYPHVFLEDVDRVRFGPVLGLCALALVGLALLLPAWGPNKWLAVPLVAGVLAPWLRRLIIRVRQRSPKWKETARTKDRLLRSIDGVLPYPGYDWYIHQVKGEAPGFLAPLPEEAVRRISVDGSIEQGNSASLRGLVANANSDWVVSGIDLRVPEGYSPASVRLPLCVLPGERAPFNVRLWRHGERRSRYRRPQWASEEIDGLHSIGTGGVFGYRMSQASPEILDMVSRETQREVEIVPWSQ